MEMNLRIKLLVISSALFAAGVQAQSSVTVYGVIDIAAQLETNGDGNGKTLKKLNSGATGGSRLGFKGTEDLGDGLKANFKLESGFAPDTGFQSDASRFFNRESWVGLENQIGDLRFGRQYNMLYEHFVVFDPMYGISNVNESVPYLAYSASDDPVHKANAVRLGVNVSGAKLGLMAAPGEGASGAYYGAVGSYVKGPNGIGAFYEQRKPGATSRKKSDYGLGGSYMVGPVILFGNFQHHNQSFPISLDLKGNLFSLGAIYPLNDRLTFFAAGYADKQKNDSTGLSGSRGTLALSAFYKLSPRTGVYAYVDTTKWKNGYVEILGDAYGKKAERQNLYLGMRHNF
jgi:predicted porin